VAILLGVAAMAGANNAAQNDARLNDVCFVDTMHGWAVGDRGTIWHTTDGGNTWNLQAAETDCALHSVSFIDKQHGWAGGGATQLYTHVSQGVVLHTRNGGRTWMAFRGALSPTIRHLHFFSPTHGVAVSQATAMFPAGVQTTNDGGRSWASLPPAEGKSWLAGEFIDPETGIVVGRTGGLGLVRRRGIEPAALADFGYRGVHRVRLLMPHHAWLVGDGGLVMHSEDAGRTWQAPKGSLPVELRKQFDFYALAVRGPKLWLAGSPGSRVLHSADGGRTWQAHATGQSLPIRDLEFSDDQHGVAVGELGTILRTDDGGLTWRHVRGGGKRAAVAGIFSEPRDAPPELFAKLAGDEGYLSYGLALHRADFDPPNPAAAELASTWHEALVAAGGSAAELAWQFPTRQPGLQLSTDRLLESWNRASDGAAMPRMVEYLVRHLRTWRPNVVVTRNATNNEPRLQLTQQLVLQAVELAADAQAFPEQLTHTGLTVWQVGKVYGALPAGETGTANIVPVQTTRSGRSVSDLAAPFSTILQSQQPDAPANVGFRLLVDRLPQQLDRKDFFSGIPLSPGGEARRALSETAEQTIDALRRSAQARRNLHAILNRDGNGLDEGRYLAEVTQLVGSMDDGHAVEVLLQLAERFHQRGQWELAADTYDSIVTRYPNHAAKPQAVGWLVRYYASGEVARQVSRRQQFQRIESAATETPAIGPNNNGELRAQPRGNITRATALVRLDGAEDDRPDRAAGYAKQLEQSSAAFAAEPTLRFPIAAAHRAQGFPRQAERFFLGFTRNRPDDVWWQCAKAELAMLGHEGDAGDVANNERATAALAPSRVVLAKVERFKPLLRCVATGSRPKLDGVLNDLAWRAAVPVQLKSPLRDDEAWPAKVMLSHDVEFLYIAAQVWCAPHTTYQQDKGPRPRDADLTTIDRIELYLDIDRDYHTAYCLSIDARGWTRETCWQSPAWNPKWYVANARSEDDRGKYWTAEAAIPWAELSAAQPRGPWAVGVQRIAPNTGFQAATEPAAITPRPEGFGLLVFE
jgi:photosystem II stability/assembly factor-like uncharacterized protein